LWIPLKEGIGGETEGNFTDNSNAIKKMTICTYLWELLLTDWAIKVKPDINSVTTPYLHWVINKKNLCIYKGWGWEPSTRQTRGVSRCGLAIYIKKYLKAKEEDLWKLKYFTMQKYNLQQILQKKPESFKI